jgi:pimeloyl-ACP methyl ester carboxylesterase
MLAALAERARPLLSEESAVEIVPGTGHFLQLEQPKRINEKIARFIG